MDENGNAHKQQGSFTKLDGTTADISDIWFAIDHTDSKDKLVLEISEEIKKLIPDIEGLGNVHSLHTAMMLDESGKMQALLTNLLGELKNGANFEDLKTQVNELMFLWAGADHYDVNARGPSIDARILYTIEAFMGKDFLQNGTNKNPASGAATELMKLFGILSDYLFDRMIYITKLHPLLNDYAINSENGALERDFSRLAASFEGEFNKNPAGFINIFYIFKKASRDYDESVIKQMVESCDKVRPSLGWIVKAMYLVPSKDLFFGSIGDDILSGSSGNDALIGGKGNDRLMGGYDSDTYIFSKGDGQDTVFDLNGSAGDYYGVDRFVFTDVAFAEVSFRAEDLALILDYGNGDSIRIEYFFDNSSRYLINEFQFTDRTINLSDLAQIEIPMLLTQVYPTLNWAGKLNITTTLNEGATLNGSLGSDTIYGGLGNDLISGGNSDDTL